MTEPLYPRHASGPVPEVTPQDRRWLVGGARLLIPGLGFMWCGEGWIGGPFLEAALRQVPERVVLK